jgi:hypothetical protein
MRALPAHVPYATAALSVSINTQKQPGTNFDRGLFIPRRGGGKGWSIVLFESSENMARSAIKLSSNI